MEKPRKSLEEKNKDSDASSGKGAREKTKSRKKHGYPEHSGRKEMPSPKMDHSKDFYPGFWPAEPKLFPAISEPAVCGYPFPVAVPVFQDPMPLYSIYQPTLSHSFKQTEMRSKRKLLIPGPSKTRDPDPCQSLPPGMETSSREGQQRRFSDPGLAASPQSDALSNSSSSTDEYPSDERIQYLTNENDRLTKELMEVKEELDSLKCNINQLMDSQNNAIPGAISDMIKQLKGATEVREKAMYIKFQQLIKDQLSSQSKRLFDEGNSPTRREFDELKEQLQTAYADRDTMNQRLIKLESFIENFLKDRYHFRHESGTLSKEQEELQARKQLQEALDYFKANKRLENRSKLVNGGSSEEKHDSFSLNSPDTCESLTSSLGSGSINSPVITFTGPVTDV